MPNPWSPGADASPGSERTDENQPPLGSGAAATAGMFGNPSIQNLMQHIMQNPQVMQNMLSAPYTQSLLQAMAADPDMASSIIGTNPMFASNPDLQVCVSTISSLTVQHVRSTPS